MCHNQSALELEFHFQIKPGENRDASIRFPGRHSDSAFPF